MRGFPQWRLLDVSSRAGGVRLGRRCRIIPVRWVGLVCGRVCCGSLAAGWTGTVSGSGCWLLNNPKSSASCRSALISLSFCVFPWGQRGRRGQPVTARAVAAPYIRQWVGAKGTNCPACPHCPLAFAAGGDSSSPCGTGAPPLSPVSPVGYARFVYSSGSSLAASIQYSFSLRPLDSRLVA